MDDVLGVVLDEELQRLAVTATVSLPQEDRVEAAQVGDGGIARQAEGLLDGLQAAREAELARDAAEVDVERGEDEIGEGRPEESKVEAGAVERGDHAEAGQVRGELRQVLAGHKDGIRLAVGDAHEGDLVIGWGQPGGFDVQVDDVPEVAVGAPGLAEAAQPGEVCGVAVLEGAAGVRQRVLEQRRGCAVARDRSAWRTGGRPPRCDALPPEGLLRRGADPGDMAKRVFQHGARVPKGRWRFKGTHPSGGAPVGAAPLGGGPVASI